MAIAGGLVLLLVCGCRPNAGDGVAPARTPEPDPIPTSSPGPQADAVRSDLPSREGLQYSGTLAVFRPTKSTALPSDSAGTGRLVGLLASGLGNTEQGVLPPSPDLAAGARSAGAWVELSAPVLPQTKILYASAGARYPATAGEQTDLARATSLTYETLLGDCPARYPGITVREPGEADPSPTELADNYALIARCAYEQFGAKPYWIPQLLIDVDVCSVAMGSSWRTPTADDLAAITADEYSRLRSSLDAVESSAGGAYFSFSIWVRTPDGGISGAVLDPSAQPRFLPLQIPSDWTLKDHYEGGLALRCLRVTDASAPPAPAPAPQPAPKDAGTPGAEPGIVGSLDKPLPTSGIFLIDLVQRRWTRVFAVPGWRLSIDAGSRSLASSGPAGIEIRSFDRTASRVIASGAGLTGVFSPDGRTIAAFTPFSAGLALYPSSDGQPQPVDLPGVVFDVAWSPTQLAVHTSAGIFFVRPDGTVVQGPGAGAGFVTQGPFPKGSEPWSRDGSMLAFSRWREQVGDEIFVVEPGGPPRSVGSVSGRVARVHWSPDATALAVLFFPSGADRATSVAVIDVSAGRVRFTLTNAGQFHLAWSPVQDLLLFDGNYCRDDWQPMVVRADGTGLRPVAARPGTGSPVAAAWTPDGREVVTSWGALRAIDVESGRMRTLVEGLSSAYSLSFVTPDLVVAEVLPAWPYCEGYVAGAGTALRLSP